MDARDADLALDTHVQLVDYALPFGVGAEWRGVRERARHVTGDAHERLVSADLDVLDLLAAGADLWPPLLVDDPARPLADWWWHLGAIRARTYPADLLPEPLRARYLELDSQAA